MESSEFQRELKMSQSKNVYFFSSELTEGNAKMKNLLGGKGANLAEMTSLGIPVPPGFTISTEVCKAFYDNGEAIPDYVQREILQSLKQIEETIGKGFGDQHNPLLVSVRSGARVSMPGMMDTILNLGLNDETVEGLAKLSGNERFAWDSYRRFIQMYSNVVMGMNHSLLDVYLEDIKDEKKYASDTDLNVEDLKNLVSHFKKMIANDLGISFPENPMDQLWGAIAAVFKSWHTPRAVTYRELHDIPEEWGTAVNIQSMVFGNMGNDSATGVAFTRDPSTGDKKFYGEYLINAQGEDVVAGIRTPKALTKNGSANGDSLEEQLPTPFEHLVDVYKKLESHYRDMQDIEFTIEQGKLWMLQTRTGKRTAKASIKIAMDLVKEGVLNEEEALLRIDPKSLDQLLHPTLDPKAEKTILTKGLPASPGGVSGQIVFSSEDAVKEKALGHKTILVRVETSPEDIEGMVSAEGILTSRGGMTSHAAVVARGMGKCCVAGCSEINVDYRQETLSVNGYVLNKGDWLTLDGSTGEVILGSINTIEPKLEGDFEQVMALADKYRKLKVRTNADTEKDSLTARRFGAEGIGLCRTEHMFFAPERIDIMREMILADHYEERVAALKKLEPFQRKDFLEIFTAMDGLPVTVRLLDPPLHEFLPHNQEEMQLIAEKLGWDVKRLENKVKSLHEFNPMLGHRGCRLAITYPEIYEMQARAIAHAACDFLEIKSGATIQPEIMIPFVTNEKELSILTSRVRSVVDNVMRVRNINFEYLVGTMIELPRAALVSDEIANVAEFFSFGTNDLTQTTLGLSRDDSGRFLSTYVSQGIYPKDPFATIDQNGVGQLVKKSVELGRQTRSNLKLGICGEHGGDPESVTFFHNCGLDYVSCSPYRVPIARLSAAQAHIKERLKIEN